MKKNRNDGSNGGGENQIKDRKKRMKKNMDRMGGRGGLSLAAFANAKTRNENYNPAVIKKQKEFYRNAKFVQKYKRLINQQAHVDAPSTSRRPSEGENDAHDPAAFNKKSRKQSQSLEALYEKTKEEEERARAERAAAIQAKAEARQQAEAKRKTQRQRMLKKTRSGQPVMKYRIEHILETLQNEAN